MATYEGYQYMKQGKTITFTQLIAAGSTDSVKVIGCKNFAYQYTIAAINTNVIVRAEGSLDNSNWFNLDIDDVNTTQTANGAYAFQYDGDGEIAYTRFTWVSEAGGTAATIDVVFMPAGTAA